MEKSDFFNENLTEEERDLYDRQFRLDGWDQSILKNSKVLIVGVGGLGCEIAKNLAMVGVGQLDLVDLDIVEHSNLNRQILFVDARMGEAKAHAAAKMLRKVNPNITINSYHSSLEGLDPRIYKDCDLIVGGLDSMKARLNLNSQAVRFNKPLVDAGVAGYHGHVYTIFPGQNACYECYPMVSKDSEEMAACTVVGVPRKRVHCVFKGHMAFEDEHGRPPDAKNIDEVNYVQEIANDLVRKHAFDPEFTNGEIVKIIDHHEPGLITINAVVSSLESHEAIKILYTLKGNKSLGTPNSQYVIYNGMSLKFFWIEKKKNLECVQCSDQVQRETIEIAPTSPCETIIQHLEQKGYELDPDLFPILGVLEYDGVREIELEETPEDANLRTYENVTVSGFISGEIQVTVILKP